MELHLSFPTTVLQATFCAVALLFLFQISILIQKTGKNKKKPPQAKGAWPIIGHLHLLGGLPHRFLANMADASGPIFTIKLGARQALVVSDAIIAKECFTINDKVFASRPKSLASVIMGYNFAMFPLSPYGEYWRQVRKMVTVELLSQRRVDMLRYIRVPEVRANMKSIYDDWERNRVMSANSDMVKVKVEMRQFFANLILNIITRSIAGKRFAADDAETTRIHEVVSKFLEILGTFVVSDFIPAAKYFDLGGYKKSMTIAAKEMDSLLEGWLVEKKKRKASGEKSEHQDFMDVLISIVEGASQDDFPGYDHDTIIRSTSLVMITAGFDSTAVTLTWALVLLLNNPETLQTAQHELDVHVGRDRLVDESDIKNLVYLQAIVKETLRLYPPAPISLTHESTDDCTVAGYNICKGTLFISNLWKLHRDPNVWSDPLEFQPERFLRDQTNIDLKGQHYELLPFGSGRRMCPGVSFALQSLYLTLASLMQGFEMSKSSNEQIDTSEIFRLTNNKKTPFEVMFSPRLSTNLYQV